MLKGPNGLLPGFFLIKGHLFSQVIKQLSSSHTVKRVLKNQFHTESGYAHVIPQDIPRIFLEILNNIPTLNK